MRSSLHTAHRPWGMRSSGAQCDQELAKRIGETLGKEAWRGRGLARRKRGRRRKRRRRRKRSSSNKIEQPSLGRWGKNLRYKAAPEKNTNNHNLIV